jgi:presenilin-like A22 family membrane protease
MYAVWKSKHMVSLANFTAESKVFAGLLVPYDKSSGSIKNKPAKSLKISKTEK